ncbi:kelch-like protein 10 [Mantella aurantiaca]
MERKLREMAWLIFNELRLEDDFCDVVIKVEDATFTAHKIILCGSSPYFRALFTSSWNKTGRKEYNIPGISPHMMRLLIEYAYTHSATVTTDNVEELFMAADQFNVLGLINRCSEFLVGQLCPQNCIGFCRFSRHFCWPELRHKVHAYLLQHFQDVVRTSEEFPDLSVTELLDIIDKDELNVKREDTVFEAVVKWIDHRPAERSRHIATLLPQVRMTLMHTDYIMDNVMANVYVKDNLECMPLFMDVFRTMYDLNKNGSPTFVKSLTKPRLPNAILLAIGGWSTSNPTNAIEAYDCRADHWVDVAWGDESPRAYHGSVYLNGYVYLIGGFDRLDIFNSVRRLDPLTKVWQQVSSMNSRRCYVSVAVLDNLIYAMGGYDGQVRMNSVECYDPETNQWNLISPMIEQRSDARATTLNGKIYICGGFNGEECLNTAEYYCPVANQWRMIASMNSQRSGVGVTAYGGHIYAVGGFDGTNRLHSAEAYDPNTNTWHWIPPMFNPRSNFGIIVFDDLLYVIGGYNGVETTATAECYDDKTGEWYSICNMNIDRSAVSCCIVPGLPRSARRRSEHYPSWSEEG